MWSLVNAVTTRAGITPDGSRVAIKSGSTVGFNLADLHGNTAAVVNSGETAYLSAARYDPYGRTAATYDSGGSFPRPLGFQGRLDVSPVSADPLYDMSARFYNPAIGAFTQLDTYTGDAADPLSLNRYLYAAANPWTLIDPTGLFPMSPCYPAVCGGGNAPPPPTPHSVPEECADCESPADSSGTEIVGYVPADPSVWVDPANWRYMAQPGQPVRGGFCPPDAFMCFPPGWDDAPDQSGGFFLSLLIQMVPVLGDLFQTAVIAARHDPISGQELTESEQQDAAAYAMMSVGLVPTSFWGRSAFTKQLQFEEAASIFTRSGYLKGSVIADSHLIIRGEDLGSSTASTLTADGSQIANWAKYTTGTYQSPVGKFQVHFYINAQTGAVNYMIDYKVVFIGKKPKL